jgi:hypothetical protein
MGTRPIEPWKKRQDDNCFRGDPPAVGWVWDDLQKQLEKKAIAIVKAWRRERHPVGDRDRRPATNALTMLTTAENWTRFGQIKRRCGDKRCWSKPEDRDLGDLHRADARTSPETGGGPGAQYLSAWYELACRAGIKRGPMKRL